MALIADEPPAPRPRTYSVGAWPGRRTATSSGHRRPGVVTAAKKFGPAMPGGVWALEWSGPASTSSTDVSGSSDRRAATTAPAEPAPTTSQSAPPTTPSCQPPPVLRRAEGHRRLERGPVRSAPSARSLHGDGTRSVRARPGARERGFVAGRGPAQLDRPRAAGRGPRVPPPLGGRAPQHARHRQLVPGGPAGPPGRRSRTTSASARAASCCPTTPPLAIAEQFGTLEALHPGRVDLGIGRAPGTDQLTARALRRTHVSFTEDEFPAQLVELLGYFTGAFPDGHPYRGITATPGLGYQPALWLLGSSDLQRPGRRGPRPAVRLRPPLRRPRH